MNNITTIEDWQQWKKVCSFSACSDQVKARLGELGHLRLKKYIFGVHENVFEDDKKRLIDRLNTSSILDTEHTNFVVNAWHLFDSRIVKMGEKKGGKNWLAENASSLGALEGRASNLFREVAREYVLEELGRRGDRKHDHLSRPVNEEGLTIEDLLQDSTPDPKDEIIAKDLIDEVKFMAKKFFDTLEFCDKISMLTIPLHLSIADDKIVKLSGLGKSRLAERKKNLIQSFGEMLSKVDGLQKFTADLVYGAENLLGEQAEAWGQKPENKCSSLFMVSDDE